MLNMTVYGAREWGSTLMAGILLSIVVLWSGFWWLMLPLLVILILLLQFFRDPEREIPPGDHRMVAPSDGTVSSIHEVEFFEPFDGPAQCVRIFMSVFNVHVNRHPCDGVVASLHYKEGKFLNTLRAISAEENEQLTTVYLDQEGKHPVAAVRQVAGAIARTIVNPLEPGDLAVRGERFGMIKYGSTTELYLPKPEHCEVRVSVGQAVKGGATVLVELQD